MKKNKPKGKTPSLIGSTLGTPRQCTTQRASDCNRCKATIPKDTSCIEIPKLGGAFQSYKRYCNSCFESILEQTQSDLNSLLKFLPTVAS